MRDMVSHPLHVSMGNMRGQFGEDGLFLQYPGRAFSHDEKIENARLLCFPIRQKLSAVEILQKS